MAEVQIYTLGRGKAFLKPAGQAYYEDFGNITDFTLSVKIEKLEHYYTGSGIRMKDAEIVKSMDYNVKIEVDELRRSTLEKFLLATGTSQNITAGSVVDEPVSNIKQGFWYKLAHEKIKKTPAPVVTNDAATPTTFTEGTDYEIDYDAGAIYIKEGGNITDGTNLKIDYSYDAWTKYVLQGGTRYSIQGELWFKGDPPVGKAVDLYADVSLVPSGDLKLIGDDWLKVSFEGTATNVRLVDRGNR
ncbi:hypothetical protein [Hydrogenobacter thermophilus]|uniref:phage tail tube protein n=1 Tax=Hydrogenobacter thermophilus TaxID=940 RepID=UPI0030F9B16A